MEDPDIRELVRSDPRGFLEKYHEGVILDEVQNTPELFSYLRLTLLTILLRSHFRPVHRRARSTTRAMSAPASATETPAISAPVMPTASAPVPPALVLPSTTTAL